MKNLEGKYKKIEAEINELLNKMKALVGKEDSEEYLELKIQQKKLSEQLYAIYKEKRMKDFGSCRHIWVNALHDYDIAEGRSYNYYGCVKCGLDQRVFHLMEIYNNSNLLTTDQRIMYDFMKDRQLKGINTKLFCDLDLGRAIYTRIKVAHPDIKDKDAAKYLRAAYYKMKESKISDKQKANRVKRLSLDPSFNKWDENGVIKR